MYLFSFIKNAITHRRFFGLFLMVVSLMFPTAIIGFIWKAKDFSYEGFWVGFLVSLLFLFVFSTPGIGEAFTKYILLGTQPSSNNCPRIWSGYSAAIATATQDTNTSYNHLRLCIVNNATFNCFSVGKKYIFISSAFEDSNESVIHGGLLWGIQNCVSDGGLGMVCVIAANSVLLASMSIWIVLARAVVKLSSGCFLGFIASICYTIDKFIIETVLINWTTFVFKYCNCVNEDKQINFYNNINDDSVFSMEEYFEFVEVSD